MLTFAVPNNRIRSTKQEESNELVQAIKGRHTDGHKK